MTGKKLRTLAGTTALVMIGAVGVAGQVDSATESPRLEALSLLEGSWAGQIDGTLGPAQGHRSYRFIMDGQFLLLNHDRDPEARATDDEVYEEWSIFSYDPVRGRLVLREFLVEGLVNTYSCEFRRRERTLACESEATEGSSGLALAVRYEMIERERFTEVFEISGADGELQIRMEGEWRRIRS